MSATLAPANRGSATWSGVGRLVRQGLRRDRTLLLVGFALLAGICFASAGATETLYPSLADRVAAVRALNASPGAVALYGPVLDEQSLGELSMLKLTVLYGGFVAVLFLVIVRRHTRGQEESGLEELLGGTAIGRYAALTAAVVLAAGAALVLGILAALAAVAGGLPVQGSLLFGASWAGLALVSTGITAVACQLSASSRTCAVIAASVLGALYLVRAVGDIGVQWLNWLSPFGWSTRLQAWSDPRWWVLGLYVVAFLVLVQVARLLRGRRDLGSGMLPARPGPATGSPRLADAVSLSVRLHTPLVVTWTVALGVMGAVMGSITPGIGSMLDSPGIREMMQRLGGEGALEDTMITAILSLLAVVVTGFGVAVIGHGGADERDGRTEQVLATAVTRARTLLATLTVVLLGSAWLMLVSGVTMATGYAAAGPLSGTFGRIVPGALVQVSAIWLVLALAVAVYAVRRGWTVVGWAFPIGFFTVGQLGELLDLPRWLVDLSPYVHVPKMPVEDFAAGPPVAMVALTGLLLLAAWGRYRARDIG